MPDVGPRVHELRVRDSESTPTRTLELVDEIVALDAPVLLPPSGRFVARDRVLLAEAVRRRYSCARIGM